MNKSGVAVFGLQVVMGRVSWSRLVLWVLSGAVLDLLLIKGVRNMDFFFIPESMIIWTIAMAVGGLLGALGWACMMKAEAGADEAWKGKYIASMFATMIVAPIIANLALGFVVQEWCPDITDLTYAMFLILASFALARYTLLFFNIGLKATVRQLTGNIKDAAEAAKDVQQTVDEVKKQF